MNNDVFCRVLQGSNEKRIIAQNNNCFAVMDGYPVNTGHMLIIPKRHFVNFFEATTEEVTDIYKLLCECKNILEEAYYRKKMPLPDGYNVGININAAGGQTIPHLHVHLIPRYKDDVNDPLGGIRGVIPEKQKYSGEPDPSVDDLLK